MIIMIIMMIVIVIIIAMMIMMIKTILLIVVVIIMNSLFQSGDFSTGSVSSCNILYLNIYFKEPV